MKKILFIIIFLISTLLVNAQLKFEGGLFLGMSASQIDGDAYGGYNKIGITTGPYVNVFMKDWLAIQTGISYITKGAHSSAKQSYMNTHLDYFEVPALANIYFGKSNISFTGGLTFGYLFRSFMDTGGGRKNTEMIDFNPCSYFSLNYKLGKNLTSKIAYNYGLIPNRGFSRAVTYEWNNTVSIVFMYRIMKNN